MTSPTTHFERKLTGDGFLAIAGCDEVGRGAWAGPLVAAAVIMPHTPRLRGIRDSKQLTPARRTELSQRIQETAIAHALGVVASHEIDELGLTAANALAMQRAVEGLSRNPDHVLVDAFTIDAIKIPQTAIIRGDQTVYSIAAASIVAKVFRDAMMQELDTEFPHYGFKAHKGYGTRAHVAALQKHGPTKHHRTSFQPIREML